MDVAALVISVIAALSAAITLLYTRGQKLAADRSATASEQSATEAKRSADAAQEAVGYQRAETERGHRARRVPPQELLDRMLYLHRAFGDIVAEGGKEALWFLNPDRQEAGSRLAALAGQIVDDELNDRLGEARSRYHNCWTVAPGHGMSDVGRTQRQVEFAREGASFLTQAIDRMNQLVREAAAPSAVGGVSEGMAPNDPPQGSGT